MDNKVEQCYFGYFDKEKLKAAYNAVDGMKVNSKRGKYELPLFVADTVWEMAKHFGVTENTVYSSISKGLSGKRNGYRFVKVCDEDEE